MLFFFFFFKQKTAYEMRISDWSSDVCSSDLIAAYRDYQSLDMPLAPSDGERVEQCLCRMFVSSIAGIQHRAIDLVSDQLHGARTLVPDHDHVSAHGVQSHGRIDQRFALFHA